MLHSHRYGMMKLCWCTRCEDRPSFEDMKFMLEDTQMSMQSHVQLHDTRKRIKCYFLSPQDQNSELVALSSASYRQRENRKWFKPETRISSGRNGHQRKLFYVSIESQCHLYLLELYMVVQSSIERGLHLDPFCESQLIKVESKEMEKRKVTTTVSEIFHSHRCGVASL